MSMTSSRSWAAALALVIGLLVMAGDIGLASAQRDPHGNAAWREKGPLEFIKPDRRIVRAQLDLSVQYGHQALDLLESGASSEDFKQASDLAWRSYHMLRFAVHGLELINQKAKYVADPLVDMAVGELTKARWLNIEARMGIDAAAEYWDKRQPGDMDVPLEKLRVSVSLIQQAADLF